jgi:hypothetical protein
VNVAGLKRLTGDISHSRAVCSRVVKAVHPRDIYEIAARLTGGNVVVGLETVHDKILLRQEVQYVTLPYRGVLGVIDLVDPPVVSAAQLKR